MKNKVSQKAIFKLGLVLILVALSRMVIQSQLLQDWDAVQFALAGERYDVFDHQPHPPGYPAISLVAQLSHTLGFSLCSALHWLNLVTFLSALVAFYMLTLRMFECHTFALTSVLCLSTSQLAWYYSSTVNAYVAELFGATVIALSCWHSISKKELKWALLATGLWTLAGSIRPFLVLTMAPLWLFSHWSYLRDKKSCSLLLAVAFVSLLIWFIPVVSNSGSFNEYKMASSALYEAVMASSSIFSANPCLTIWKNLNNLIQALCMCLGPFVVCLLFSPMRSLSDLQRRFVSLWLVPPICFYLLIHFGRPGYLMTVAPPLVWLAASKAFKSGKNRLFTALFVIINSSFFLLAPFELTTFEGKGLFFYTESSITSFDKHFSRLVSSIREDHSSSSTVICTLRKGASCRLFRSLAYYLPEYEVIEVSSRGDFIIAKEHARAPAPKEFGSYEMKSLLEDKKRKLGKTELFSPIDLGQRLRLASFNELLVILPRLPDGNHIDFTVNGKSSVGNALGPFVVHTFSIPKSES